MTASIRSISVCRTAAFACRAHPNNRLRARTPHQQFTSPHLSSTGYEPARFNNRLRVRTLQQQVTGPHASATGYESTHANNRCDASTTVHVRLPHRHLCLPRPPHHARFRVQGAGCRVQGSGCRVQGAGCRDRVQDSGFRVQCQGSSSRPSDATPPLPAVPKKMEASRREGLSRRGRPLK